MNKQSYIMSSFGKIVSILNLFTMNRYEYSLKEIQEQIPINKTSLYRIMSNLVQHDLLEKDEITKNYKLGPLLVKLGFVASNNYRLRDTAKDVLKKLAVITGQTVHLSQRIGSEVIILDRQDGSGSLAVKSTPGMTRPLHSTASGKLLTAHLDDDELDKLMALMDFRRYTENTIIDPKTFYHELIKIKDQGYALDDREHNVDVSCIAVPVWWPSRKVIASLSISGPYFYFNPESIPGFVKGAKSAAEEITAKVAEVGIGNP